MQRVCFCKTVSLFNHVLQPSQAFALFYQSLLFALQNLALIKWISSNIGVPIGLQLLMIDINGNVTVDDELLYKHLSESKRDVGQRADAASILKWISRLVLRLITDYSMSSKVERSPECEDFHDFLKQFYLTSPDDRSTLSDDDEGIISDDLDEEDISRRAIHRALLKCVNYTAGSAANAPQGSAPTTDMHSFESNPVALYNQQIIQILCSDTLELEIELAQNCAALWRDVTTEYLQFSNEKGLRKVTVNSANDGNQRRPIRETDRMLDEITRRQRSLKKPTLPSSKPAESPGCLHDRLMSEIKQDRKLKPIGQSHAADCRRKRIQPVNDAADSDSSSDDDQRDEHGRRRVLVVDCLLETSPEDNLQNESPVSALSEHHPSLLASNQPTTTAAAAAAEKINYATIESLGSEYISMEKLLSLQERVLQLLKDSSETLSLTFDEFCHIRNVITRSELETLLFDDKLYNEVAQGKLCFTCRKVYFNLLTLTFGIQCGVCKQRICRNCVKQITLPKERLNDLPIQAITPLTLSKSLSNSERCHSLDTHEYHKVAGVSSLALDVPKQSSSKDFHLTVSPRSPHTPTMNDVMNELCYDDGGSRRCSTPGHSLTQANASVWRADPIDICTDCFFLLQQIRKKSRQLHVSPTVSSSLVSSTSSSFNRSHHSPSSYNLSASPSTSSIAALLAAQQQQRSLMVKTTSIHANLKPAKSAQELSASNHPLQALAAAAVAAAPTNPAERVSLSRQNLFLKLQPAYDIKATTNIKTG